MEDMKKIRDLQNKVTQLETLLPGEGVEVKPGDTHMKLAVQYLERRMKVGNRRRRRPIGSGAVQGALS